VLHPAADAGEVGDGIDVGLDLVAGGLDVQEQVGAGQAELVLDQGVLVAEVEDTSAGVLGALPAGLVAIGLDLVPTPYILPHGSVPAVSDAEADPKGLHQGWSEVRLDSEWESHVLL